MAFLPGSLENHNVTLYTLSHELEIPGFEKEAAGRLASIEARIGPKPGRVV
jgi:hypothetical protein